MNVNHLSPEKPFQISSDENYSKNQFQIASSGFSPRANSKSLTFGTPRWNSNINLPPVYSPSVHPQAVPFSMSPSYQQQKIQQPPSLSRQLSPLSQQQEAKISTMQFIRNNGQNSLPVKCIHCSENVFTKTHYESNLCIYVAAICLCTLSCLGCIPFCVKNAKDVRHTCPRCNTYLGTYRRWGI